MTERWGVSRQGGGQLQAAGGLWQPVSQALSQEGKRRQEVVEVINLKACSSCQPCSLPKGSKGSPEQSWQLEGKCSDV